MAAQIHIQNLAAFLEAVEEAKKYAADLTDPLHRIGRQWMRTNKNFFRQSPGMFADLSNGRGGQKVRGFGDKRTGEKGGGIGGYKLAKQRRWGFIYPILRASGALERSLTVPGDPNNLFEILNRETLILGTRAVSRDGANYPAFLNNGTRYMPARNFLTISELTQAAWIRELKEFIGAAWGAPGKPPAKAQKAPSPIGSPAAAADSGGGESEAAPAVASMGGGGGGGGGGGAKKKKKKR